MCPSDADTLATFSRVLRLVSNVTFSWHNYLGHNAKTLAYERKVPRPVRTLRNIQAEIALALLQNISLHQAAHE